MATIGNVKNKVSLYSAALLNHTSYNQGDHCIIADGKRLEEPGNHTTMLTDDQEKSQCGDAKFGADDQVKAYINGWRELVGMKPDNLKKVF